MMGQRTTAPLLAPAADEKLTYAASIPLKRALRDLIAIAFARGDDMFRGDCRNRMGRRRRAKADGHRKPTSRAEVTAGSTSSPKP
ncbi:MAG: hypothetical protein NVS3B20_27690 [Polyangiales bacterium]